MGSIWYMLASVLYSTRDILSKRTSPDTCLLRSSTNDLVSDTLTWDVMFCLLRLSNNSKLQRAGIGPTTR